MLKQIITCCLLMMATLSFAQEDNSVYVATSFELPLGDLKHIYNSTFNYEVGYRSAGTYFISDIYLNYTNFTPKEDIFYFLETQETYGSVIYSDLRFIALGASGAYRIIPFNKYFTIDAGAFMNVTMTDFSYELDATGLFETSEMSAIWLGIGPKVNFNFLLTDHLSLSINNRLVYVISTDDLSFDYTFTSFQTGVGLEYLF
ncbi:hypothetical protein [Flammeovirga sp. EKP202]|uniref:hypothetical protein n=1 Tax=Flammeovirga sp. EKP202 TaxID=2770592 RepID=UPI00165F03C3|nr:hypothetical protein [Flammeovirga sp. EKP202]MBD0405413.1 hypothetical protein [Flammeovirga sp. EKP202]